MDWTIPSDSQIDRLHPGVGSDTFEQRGFLYQEWLEYAF